MLLSSPTEIVAQINVPCLNIVCLCSISLDGERVWYGWVPRQGFASWNPDVHFVSNWTTLSSPDFRTLSELAIWVSDLQDDNIEVSAVFELTVAPLELCKAMTVPEQPMPHVDVLGDPWNYTSSVPSATSAGSSCTTVVNVAKASAILGQSSPADNLWSQNLLANIPDIEFGDGNAWYSVPTGVRLAGVMQGRPAQPLCESLALIPRIAPAIVVDVFLFSQEAQIVVARLEELAPYVDLFIALECEVSFQGHPRELQFSKISQVFEPVSRQRLHSLKVDHSTLPKEGGFLSENAVRDNAILDGSLEAIIRARFPGRSMHGVRLILSDVDEVPKREIGAIVRNCDGFSLPATLDMADLTYSLRWRRSWRLGLGTGPKIVSLQQLTTSFSPSAIRRLQWQLD